MTPNQRFTLYMFVIGVMLALCMGAMYAPTK